QGQHCEQCTLGYRRAQRELGPFSSCEVCNCHGHSDACHPDTGACDCQDNTAGLSCERCKDGFYGDATQGAAGDCRPCNCNPIGSTSGDCDIDSGQCECQPGVAGQHCDRCEVNFFGTGQGQGCRQQSGK
uniref:Laminin EGF-like domain-containing protein n=1 Tax=Xiphophorus couchianus TaxID=32473 RepID=A0A3B5MY42_9TELE